VSQKSLNDEERGGNCLLVSERSYGPAIFRKSPQVRPGLLKVGYSKAQLLETPGARFYTGRTPFFSLNQKC